MVTGQYMEYDNDLLERKARTAVGYTRCVRPAFHIEYRGRPGY